MRQLHSASRDLADTAASLDIPVQLRLVNEGNGISAHLGRVDRGFLKLSTPLALLNDLRVEVTIDGCTICTEVVSCEQQSPGRFTVAVRRVYGPQGATRGRPGIRTAGLGCCRYESFGPLCLWYRVRRDQTLYGEVCSLSGWDANRRVYSAA
jgi:hypothetical protein